MSSEYFTLKGVKFSMLTREEIGSSDDEKAILPNSESPDSIPVFYSCDETRKKIRVRHKASTSTQTAFLREIAALFGNGRKASQSKQLSDFLSKRGAMAENASGIFHADYVFFKKLRIREGKPKS
ncbi:hypothetical protein B0O99DRAFT_695276 [Bisporella sp. PMI_857]|nr:hypothetical protein B0O99DRAFT_695276 [Bisporella sp. PMI_857]